MRIAVVLGGPDGQYPFQYWYQVSLVKALAMQHPQSQWLLVNGSIALQSPLNNLPENITLQQMPLKKHSYWALRYWYNIRLPLVLRKWKPDVCWQLGQACSNTLRTPQYWWYQPLVFTNATKWLLPLYTKLASRVLQKSVLAAAGIQATHTMYLPQAGTKVITQSVAALPLIQPFTYEQREQVKDGYTDGREYFLCIMENDSLPWFTHLLKAFSRFKKWQQSNMKLVIAGTMPPAIILDKLSSYKYREDVVLVPMPDDGQWHALLAAAYALVYLPAYTHAAPVANAMQAQVPVIIHDNQANHAIWGDAVLYSKPEDTAHLSQQLIHLYKNESSRSNMIARAAALQQANSFNTMLHQLCTSLQQLAKPH